MFRSYRYPLYPTVAEEATLTHWLAMCCDLYNGALQERREAWRKQRRTVTLSEQSRALTEIRATVPGWDAVPRAIARSALDRLDRSMRAFFRRCKAGQVPGFPRFRSKQRYDSFGLGSAAAQSERSGTLTRDGRVAIPLLGLVKFHQYRPLPPGALVRDVIVRREAGKWYVIFQCDVGPAPAKPDPAAISPAREVGIDVGLTSLATLSSGEVIANPSHGRTSAETLAARQRKLARKRPGSKSRQRARLLVAKAHAHIANQRRDTARKAAANLVSRYDLIAYEDLNIRGLVHGSLARSIHDAGWRLLLQAITCKAESAGTYAVAVDPRGTTQRCCVCGAHAPKGLGDRRHECPANDCGIILDRDVNAAINILALGQSAVRLLATPRVTAEGQPTPLAA